MEMALYKFQLLVLFFSQVCEEFYFVSTTCHCVSGISCLDNVVGRWPHDLLCSMQRAGGRKQSNHSSNIDCSTFIVEKTASSIFVECHKSQAVLAPNLGHHRGGRGGEAGSILRFIQLNHASNHICWYENIQLPAGW